MTVIDCLQSSVLAMNSYRIPTDEPLCVTSGEVPDLAHELVGTMRYSSNNFLDYSEIQRQILAGDLKFSGHPVIVI